MSKRVINFFDMFDTVPPGCKYLYSNRWEFPLAESEEQKSKRIINGGEAANTVLYTHYYEVPEEIIVGLMKNGFFDRKPDQKIKDFMKLQEKFRVQKAAPK